MFARRVRRTRFAVNLMPFSAEKNLLNGGEFMWDETKPVKLMGALSYDAFSMQHIIDTDKYVAGEILGYDVCGKYAAFCKVCDKTVANPCVTAYRISQRMETVCPLLDSAEIDDARVVQAVTDVDKYLASEGFGIDLCGRYAPFCAVCDKSEPFPCGQAYLRLRAVENFSTKAVTAQVGGELAVNVPRWDDALTQALAESSSEGADIAAARTDVAETVVEAPRRGFRIGVARRRVNPETANAEGESAVADEAAAEVPGSENVAR